MKTHYDELAAKLIATYGADTALCDIDPKNFTFGSDFDALLKAVNYDETAQTVITIMRWWGLTVGELIDRERPASYRVSVSDSSSSCQFTVTGGAISSMEHGGGMPVHELFAKCRLAGDASTEDIKEAVEAAWNDGSETTYEATVEEL